MRFKTFIPEKVIDLFAARKNSLRTFCLVVLIFLLSFPKTDPSLTIGLDASWDYAINYLFAHGVHFGKDVAFTYGPLGFLQYPLIIGNNFLIAILFSSSVLLFFIFSCLQLGKITTSAQTASRWLLHSAIILFICVTSLSSGIQFLLVGSVATSLLIHRQAQRWWWLAAALLCTVIALLIKSTPGFLSLLMFFSYLSLDFYSYRSWQRTLLFFLLIPACYLFLWFMIYFDLIGSLDYLRALLEHAKGNSSAMALYPDNNWFHLGAVFILFFSLFFLLKENRARLFFLLMLLPTFAVWKYSYTREDSHVETFYDYLILFFGLLFLCMKEIRMRHILLAGATLMILYRSMFISVPYQMENNTGQGLWFNGINNFYETFFTYKELVERSKKQSLQNIQPNVLAENVKKIIGNSSVDIYPWEYSYIEANNFHWKCKPVIQAYTAYTKWLDKRDANFFSATDANISANFIIWHYTFGFNDNAENLAGIDNGYLLNHEPQAIYQLLNHYKLIYKDASIMLLKKSETENLAAPSVFHLQSCRWNEWVNVPETKDGILRVRTTLHGGLLRMLKIFFYKDEEFKIACKLSDGTVRTFRFSPENAENGLWINPLLKNLSGEKIDANKTIVKQIAFYCSNTFLMKDEINLDWEIIRWKEKKANPASDSLFTQPVPYHSTFSFFHLN